MNKKARWQNRQPKNGPNKTEEAYGYFLGSDESVHSVLFEKIKLKLANKTFYTPDFMVLKNDGAIEFHEVKGFMRDDAAVKLKVAAEQFPFVSFFLVRKSKTGWEIQEIRP